ncbi:hypothetical protein ACFLRA_02810 [Bdellovibrionota bacterium]
MSQLKLFRLFSLFLGIYLLFGLTNNASAEMAFQKWFYTAVEVLDHSDIPTRLPQYRERNEFRQSLFCHAYELAKTRLEITGNYPCPIRVEWEYGLAKTKLSEEITKLLKIKNSGVLPPAREFVELEKHLVSNLIPASLDPSATLIVQEKYNEEWPITFDGETITLDLRGPSYHSLMHVLMLFTPLVDARALKNRPLLVTREPKRDSEEVITYVLEDDPRSRYELVLHKKYSERYSEVFGFRANVLDGNYQYKLKVLFDSSTGASNEILLGLLKEHRSLENMELEGEGPTRGTRAYLHKKAYREFYYMFRKGDLLMNDTSISGQPVNFQE